ncbi:MAG TPA: class I SAM-dependent methyltransferase [Burkholderiaceae bacterium]|jgi:SAM-dependent methyltransferase|nr:class I SAM-dependent methyltransferase [Burkholderiaceae bacterium]
MKLYSALAAWWPLLSPPAHYVEEADDLLPDLRAATGASRTLLELGSGGGSLAFHLQRHFALTLTDISEPMLAVSRAVNPECEHLCGDMRTLALGRQFDLVLIHDAIMYATDEDALRATLATAYRHCRPGGTVVVLPDCVRETFAPGASSGGEDGPDGRGLRYLEWSWDPDPDDTAFEVAYAVLLRDADGAVRAEFDRHRCGLFARATWLRLFAQEGLAARAHRSVGTRRVQGHAHRTARVNGCRPGSRIANASPPRKRSVVPALGSGTPPPATVPASPRAHARAMTARLRETDPAAVASTPAPRRSDRNR